MDKDRRKFLGELIGFNTTLATIGSATIGNMMLFGVPEDKPHDEKPGENDTKEKSVSEIYPGIIVNTNIKGRKFKNYGVEHTKRFAKKNYDTIDKLVRDASIVVTEGSPHGNGGGNFNSYFNTVFNLCKEHNKPVLYLDPQKTEAILTEHTIGLAAGVYASWKSFQIVTKDSTRRDALKNSAKTLGGLYFFMSSFFNSMILKSLIYNGDIDQSNADERFYLGHVTDQRNVELTNRLLELPDLLEPELFEDGDYVLTNFGAAHTIGIDHYLKHSLARKFKSAIYKYTYDQIDSDEIALYIPKGSSWEKKVIRS